MSSVFSSASLCSLYIWVWFLTNHAKLHNVTVSINWLRFIYNWTSFRNSSLTNVKTKNGKERERGYSILSWYCHEIWSSLLSRDKSRIYYHSKYKHCLPVNLIFRNTGWNTDAKISVSKDRYRNFWKLRKSPISMRCDVLYVNIKNNQGDFKNSWMT